MGAGKDARRARPDRLPLKRVENRLLGKKGGEPDPPQCPCDIPSGCCFFTGPWTVTSPSLRVLRRVTAFCRPLQPVVLLVSFSRPVVGVLGLC